jgi:hypothetical protein
VAIFEIPTTQDDAHHALQVLLDGVEYQLVLKYNGRQSIWYLDLLDAAGARLRSGIAVVTGWPLLLRYTDVERRPAGELMAVPVGEDINAPSLAQLGEDVVLIYSGES